ncbi:hypothetical protein BC936DRAFT_146606 [Jimgerdemannia flammicorona]|uniref:Uncharacterized protein n=1 Tax=Jimgerdemannia flammicorona TaxID=994334 RepID=A0A433D7W2_9FUNG|nr:hypothetical protein BC936DRAFT_146606 [Jimgerdemannia flammicorona]
MFNVDSAPTGFRLPSSFLAQEHRVQSPILLLQHGRPCPQRAGGRWRVRLGPGRGNPYTPSPPPKCSHFRQRLSRILLLSHPSQGTHLTTLRTHMGVVSSIDYHPSDAAFVSGGVDGFVNVWGSKEAMEG